MAELFTIKDASKWASELLQKRVTTSNISYLIQYGRVKKYGDNGAILIDKKELIKYYKSYNGTREIKWKNKLGNDLNWALSFDYLSEAETTKHVHRLHPYKGKFIPQLVEYFLDSHTDNYKNEIYFRNGDIILDPFCGCGTTLVQANELGMHAIGIDISAFNSLISNVKIKEHNLFRVLIEAKKISEALRNFLMERKTSQFEKKLLEELNTFNSKYFPSPEYKYKVRNGEINEKQYAHLKENEFLGKYFQLVNHYKIKLLHGKSKSFLDKWYLSPVRDEIDFVFNKLKKVKDEDTKKVLTIILSRTIRSCRATTHSDLATLKKPVSETYYCRKHGKICKPLFSILTWWERYTQDTLQRLNQFEKLRNNDTYQICITDDSRTVDITKTLYRKHRRLSNLIKEKKISGIFSSPPYVGLINYHVQHAYAYDLFGFDRNDGCEIGPLYRGQSKTARDSYVKGISDVLNNCKRFLVKDFNIFLVANDKYNLYPTIAEKTNLKIVNQFKRPVLNRTEKDKSAYSEIIFHLKEKN